jgi:hypothetical protein
MIPGLERELLSMTDENDQSTSDPRWPYAVQSAGELSSLAIERSGQQMSREDLLSGVCAQLMLRLDPPITSLKLDSFAVEMGQRVSVKPDHVASGNKEYIVSLRTGGS